MTEQDNLQIVKEAYAAFNRDDIQAVLNTLADDVEWFSPGPPDVIPIAGLRRGREQVAQFFAAINESSEIEQYELRELIAQGDHVVALTHWRSRVKSTGRRVETDIAEVFTLRDGKVIKFRDYYDTAASVEAHRATSQAATGS